MHILKLDFRLPLNMFALLVYIDETAVHVNYMRSREFSPFLM